MSAHPKQETRPTNLELPIDVIESAREFAQSRGETLSEVVVAALQRHMANPPPSPSSGPLPPVPAVAPPSAADLIHANEDQGSEETKFGKLEARADAARTEEEQKAAPEKDKGKK